MLTRLFNRRLWLTLLWMATIALVALGINLLGIHALGSANAWSHWLAVHRWHFLAWRLCLYGATAYGWWWMRGRIMRRELLPETAARLRRTEFAALLAILALEGSAFMQSS